MAEESDLPAQPEFLLFKSEDGNTRIQVRLAGETVWLTQADLAELYLTTTQNVTIHIRNIYASGELDEGSTCKDFLQVRMEGERRIQRDLKHYNLDMILAIGYRVRSARGTQFRQWATERLREYLVKGFTIDDRRLKEGAAAGADYFDELLERIRDIRASERRFNNKRYRCHQYSPGSVQNGLAGATNLRYATAYWDSRKIILNGQFPGIRHREGQSHRPVAICYAT